MRIKLALPVAEHEVWTQQAVDGLVGQTPMFEGEHATVIAAELEDGQPYITLEIPDSFASVLQQPSVSVLVHPAYRLRFTSHVTGNQWFITDGQVNYAGQHLTDSVIRESAWQTSSLTSVQSLAKKMNARISAGIWEVYDVVTDKVVPAPTDVLLPTNDED